MASVDFVQWLVLLALILHLTPTGRSLSRAWRAVAVATVLCGAVWVATGLLRQGPLPAPWQDIANPLSMKQAAWWMPDVPAGAQRVCSNDVYVDHRGLIYLIDRNRGLSILERV